MKNVIVILAGGVGNRFGDPVPKQYHLVHGRPVIEYALSAALDCSAADKVLVVAREDYADKLRVKYGVEVVIGGEERNVSFRHALDYLGEKGGCERIVVVDAVNPLVTSALFNRFFGFLDDYDAAITVSKIPTSLGCYDMDKVDRSRYYMIQNPQAYDFKTLYQCFDENSNFTVVAHQLPPESNIKLYWGFKDYAKIIYPHDIAVIEALLTYREKNKQFNCYRDDACLRFLSTMRKEWPEELRSWEKDLNALVKTLFDRWSIKEYRVSPDSWKGLVFEAYSDEYGDVVLKIVPPFTNLFQRNMVAILEYADSYMTNVYDYDEDCGALLMPRVIPGDYMQLDGNEKILHEFFESVYENMKSRDQVARNEIVPSYADELKHRAEILERYDFEKERCRMALACAIDKYDGLLGKYSEVLIHGDLHRKNILLDRVKAKAIDPWAFFAAPPIEIAVYLAYFLRDSSGELRVALDEAEQLFGDIVPVSDIEEAVYIVICVLLVGTIFGKSDDYASAKNWLRILESTFGPIA